MKDAHLRECFTELYQRQRLFGKSDGTVRLYHFTLNHFDKFLKREATLKDLTDDKLMDFLEWLVCKRKQSLSTANKARDQIVALWTFLARKRLVEAFPEVPKLPEPERTPVAWTQAELAQLWQALAAQEGHVSIHRIPADRYWLALHSVCWDSLERIGAVMQLRWVDLQGRFLRFRAEIRKGRRKPSTSELHPTTLELLEAIREPERKVIFPWTDHPHHLWTRYKKIRAAAGLPDDRGHSFHCMRKSGASFAEAAGVDASRLLGHSSRALTERCYIDPTIATRPQACNVLFRPGESLANLPEPVDR